MVSIYNIKINEYKFMLQKKLLFENLSEIAMKNSKNVEKNLVKIKIALYNSFIKNF